MLRGRLKCYEEFLSNIAIILPQTFHYVFNKVTKEKKITKDYRNSNLFRVILTLNIMTLKEKVGRRIIKKRYPYKKERMKN